MNLNFLFFVPNNSFVTKNFTFNNLLGTKIKN